MSTAWVCWSQSDHLQVPECHARITALEKTGVDGQPSVAAMLEEAAGLQQQQELFEMHVSQYLPLTRCQVVLVTDA